MTVADNTADKQQIGRPFEPGKSGNPKGRPKGSRNKLSESFVEALADEFEKHGLEALIKVREEKPDVFLKLVADLVPKDMNVNLSSHEDRLAFLGA